MRLDIAYAMIVSFPSRKRQNDEKSGWMPISSLKNTFGLFSGINARDGSQA
jgi:hypothetical protein